jgi:hypothetical protein
MADRQARLASALDDLARLATDPAKGTAAPVGERRRCRRAVDLERWWSG